MKKPNYYLLFFIVFFLAFGAILFSIENTKSNIIYQKLIQQEEKIKIEKIFSDVRLEAKAISIYDMTSNTEIYGKNQNEILPIASLAKTMTVLVTLDNYLPNDQIVISRQVLEEDGNDGLILNEKWTVADLCKFSLICSSNYGVKVLAGEDKDFIKKMNLKAKEIGMQDAYFSNSTGLDINIKNQDFHKYIEVSPYAGAYVSAFDVNKMNIFALQTYRDIFNATTLADSKIKSLLGIEHDVKNTNLIIGKIPNLLFSKTGYTELAGGNLSIIFKNKEGHEIAITLLGSTKEGRFSDMEKLVQIAYNVGYEFGD